MKAPKFPTFLFGHPAYRALPPTERALLIELVLLAANDIGTDEPLVCSSATAGNMANVSWQVARRALLGLRQKGFIVLIKSGERRRGTTAGLASEWRVTCLPYQGEPPTADYNRLYWKAQDKLTQPVPKTPFSNASARTFETASEYSEEGTADSKSAYMAFTGETPIEKSLIQQEKNSAFEKSGMFHQRSNIYSPANRTESADGPINALGMVGRALH
jgi:hypothetical protein